MLILRVSETLAIDTVVYNIICVKIDPFETIDDKIR